MKFFFKKRAQISIFIVSGVLISGLILFLFLFNKDISFFKRPSSDPNLLIKRSIENSIKQNEEDFFKEKRFLEEFKIFYLYKEEKVPFSCYSTEFYFPCVQQSPLFIESIRKKMENKISRDLSRAILILKEDYENKGYSFEYDSFLFELIFEEQQISYNLKSEIKISKGETSFSVSSLNGKVKSSLPYLLRTAEAINNYESSFCEFDFMIWQALNRNVKIERFRGGDQTKVYTLKSLDNKEIKFAIRTCVMPAGI